MCDGGQCVNIPWDMIEWINIYGSIKITHVYGFLIKYNDSLLINCVKYIVISIISYYEFSYKKK